MLKKTRSILSLLLIIIALGLAIRYFSNSFTEGDNRSISTAPLFTSSMIDPNAKAQNLSKYKGKIIVLNFWATWCPPCREEMPELSQLHQRYQSKNVVVLGVAIDELHLVKEYLQTSPVTYPILITENAGMDLSDQLGNNQGVLPYTLIINADGKVVETYFGRVSQSLLEPVIKSLLSQ